MNFLKKIFSKNKDADFDLIVSEVNTFYNIAPSDFGGGCAIQKALALVFYIKEFNLTNSVDIGVYRGRSLFPQAIAHKNFTGGKVFGIDPFENKAAIQNDKPELKTLLDNFAETTDFELIYKELNHNLQSYSLDTFSTLIREKSESAKAYFKNNNLNIGLVHIDGNHDTSFVVNDVNDYFPLVQSGGVIILDDISWESVKPAFDLISQKSEYIGKIIDDKNDFAVFIKDGSISQINKAKVLLKRISNYKIKD